MSINSRSKRTVAVLGSALALTGIGGGLALASSSPQAVTPQTSVAAQPSTVSPATSTRDVPTPGDQTDKSSTVERETADAPGQEGVENPANEKANEPANEQGQEPANGHEDAPGQNIDHQFEGVE
ncbi:MAG: hypothetical protein R2878_05870 [Thermoleophilia bacterium]